jgi:eukaryotic-like serine/threonine-protein kinase
MTLPELPVSGLVAGKYEVVGLIGRGGMGSVWEGRHASLGTRVAIKFIDPEYAESKEAQSRFVNEARAAATIQTKHAIQIYDHGVTDDGRPYIVMELLLGEPLDKRVERLGRISLAETARVLVQVCRALQRAHDAGIIHRDLKPENIFLVRSPDDEDEIAKVLDFGIAKIKGPVGEPVTSSTKTGAVLGTPYYMSPEQARGLRSIDTRSDLWSIGVIAYKCVTGVLPFEGESVGDLLVKICTAPVPRPSATLPGLPAAFDAWFLRALEREPAQRFATATELADALAFAAGITMRRGPTSSQKDGPVAATMGMTPTPGGMAREASVPIPPYAATPMPTAAMTSAPFTTSARVPRRSGRAALFSVLAAAIVGLTIGVVAVVKVLSTGRHPSHPPASPAASAGAAGSTPTAVVTSSSPAAPSPSQLPPLVETPTAAPKSTATSVAATAGRPPRTSPPVAIATAKPTAVAPPPLPSAAPTAKPTAKPVPATGDPGY